MSIGSEKGELIPQEINKATRAIITNEWGEVLLGKRALDTFEGGKWSILGGKIDENEHPNDSITREIKEEVGINISSHIEYVGKRLNTSSTWLTYWFMARIFETNEEDLAIDLEELEEVKFVPQEQLRDYDLAFNHLETVLDILR